MADTKQTPESTRVNQTSWEGPSEKSGYLRGRARLIHYQFVHRIGGTPWRVTLGISSTYRTIEESFAQSRFYSLVDQNWHTFNSLDYSFLKGNLQGFGPAEENDEIGLLAQATRIDEHLCKEAIGVFPDGVPHVESEGAEKLSKMMDFSDYTTVLDPADTEDTYVPPSLPGNFPPKYTLTDGSKANRFAPTGQNDGQGDAGASVEGST